VLRTFPEINKEVNEILKYREVEITKMLEEEKRTEESLRKENEAAQ